MFVSIRSGQIRNVDSAKVSMPGQIVKYVRVMRIASSIFRQKHIFYSSCISGLLATNELPLDIDDNELSPPTKFTNPLAISEDAELETDEPTVMPSFKIPTDLTDSKKFVTIFTVPRTIHE